MTPMHRRRIARVVHWLVLVLSVLLVVSGLGITEYQTVTALTFGLLGKATAFKLHLVLWMPFLIALVAHVLLTTRLLRRRPTKGSSASE